MQAVPGGIKTIGKVIQQLFVATLSVRWLVLFFFGAGIPVERTFTIQVVFKKALQALFSRRQVT